MEQEIGLRVEALGAESWQARQSAFIALQKYGPEALEALIAGTKHSNWWVRRGCADLMDHLADDRCVTSLLQLLQDPVVAVRRLALHALSCQGCKACPLQVDIITLLIDRATRDESIRVRRAAVHQLGCQPADIRAKEALEEILQYETDDKCLRTAAWALTKHVDPSLS
jgi:HEAT repeat protein